MNEGEKELFMEGFAIIIKPPLHGIGAMGRFMGVTMSRVEIGIKGYFHED